MASADFRNTPPPNLSGQINSISNANELINFAKQNLKSTSAYEGRYYNYKSGDENDVVTEAQIRQKLEELDPGHSYAVGMNTSEGIEILQQTPLPFSPQYLASRMHFGNIAPPGADQEIKQLNSFERNAVINEYRDEMDAKEGRALIDIGDRIQNDNRLTFENRRDLLQSISNFDTTLLSCNNLDELRKAWTDYSATVH